MRLVIWTLVILSIAFYFFIVPPDEETQKQIEAQNWNPPERIINRLELNKNWSDIVRAPTGGRCILFDRPRGQEVTVQYKLNESSDWQFFNSGERFVPSRFTSLRFRAIGNKAFIYYEERPSNACVRSVLKGVGDNIKVKMTLPVGTWSTEVEIPKKMCIKWWGHGQGISTQGKPLYSRQWVTRETGKPMQATHFRWSTSRKGSHVTYQLRPIGQCRD